MSIQQLDYETAPTMAKLPLYKLLVKKINEIIRFINGEGTGSYKEYVAILTQSGSTAPTVVVLKNTLGKVPAWSYVGAGSYLATSTGSFTVGKTVIEGPFLAGIPNTTSYPCYSSGSDDANTVYVLTHLFAQAGGTNAATNGLLDGAGYNHISIKVYN